VRFRVGKLIESVKKQLEQNLALASFGL